MRSKDRRQGARSGGRDLDAEARALLESYGVTKAAFWPAGWSYPPMAPWLAPTDPALAARLRPIARELPPPPPPTDDPAVRAEAAAMTAMHGGCVERFWPVGEDFPPTAPWLEATRPELAELMRPPSAPRVWTFPLEGGALRVSVFVQGRLAARARRLARNRCGCETSESKGTRRDWQPAGVVEWLTASGEVTRQETVRSYQGLERKLEGWLEGQPEAQRGEVREYITRLKEEGKGPTKPSLPSCEEAPTPASNAGLLGPGQSACCKWEVPAGVRTIYISLDGEETVTGPGGSEVTNNGSRIDRPTTLRYVQEELGLDSPTRVFPGGLRILFARGECWEWDDRGHSAGAFLDIQASGTEDNPIFIGAYINPLAPSIEPPKFRGDGAMVFNEKTKSKKKTVRSVTITEPSGDGIRLTGSSWVQIESLSIHNCDRGIRIWAFTNSGRPSLVAPIRGARNINLVDLKIYENWVDGIAVNTAWADSIEYLTSEAGYEASALVVVGRDRLWGFVPAPSDPDDSTSGHALVEIPFIDPEGWWCEKVCIENCEVYANGQGSGSAGSNISLSGLTSLCTVRHCEIYGAPHSGGTCADGSTEGGWYNQCGRYQLGYEDPGSVGISEPWLSGDEDLLMTWGNDGITATHGGCGNIIENNIIRDHAVQQGTANCQTDDGNGIDLKSAGNRTYWEKGDDGVTWVLSDLPKPDGDRRR